ncbi:MAG: hypothetical protein GTO71_03870, partial [Woeseiaceae bacterium]|nr:hypothetical protein [Woeseiaceae bacterium]NIP20241.1 hypothetical protein [Woeseiaceae bacterium]
MKAVLHERLLRLLLAAFAISTVAACGGGNGDGGPPKEGVAGYYDGRVIKWIIPYSPGGGYDEYGRLIAPYLEKYTGSRVDIVNLPGAGGMRGANELFNAVPDGLTIGLINGSALVMNEIAGMPGADYEIADFEYLGRIVADRRVLVITLASGYDTFEDLWDAGRQVKIGATGLGGSTYVDAVIVNEAYGANFDIIHGFDSSSVVRQAMLRGNIVGTWASWGSALDAVDQGRDKIILQSGEEAAADLPDVPLTSSMVDRTDDSVRAQKILKAWEKLHAVGRPVAAPPGTNPERVAFLSEALDKALHDPELMA